jgi:hypothetical protein
MLYYTEKGGFMLKKLATIGKKIEKVKEELLQIGEMRPGSLTMQYQKPAEKQGGYYQISYTHKMRSRTEYVRPEFVEDLKMQVENFKRFKALTQEWADLAIEYSKLKMDIAKRSKNKVS